MRKKSVLVIAVVGFMFVLAGCNKMLLPTGPSEAVAADAAKGAPGTASIAILSFSPSQVTVNVGDDIVIEAVVENVVNLYGIATTISFDHNNLYILGDEEGEFLKKQKNPTSMMSAVRLQDPDKMIVGVSSLGKVSGVSGSGTLFRVTFRALRHGRVSLSFIETALRDATNSDIAFESHSATITIR